MIKALKFYADTSPQAYDVIVSDYSRYIDVGKVLGDKGRVAREALAAVKGGDA